VSLNIAELEVGAFKVSLGDQLTSVPHMFGYTSLQIFSILALLALNFFTHMIFTDTKFLYL